MAWRASVTDAGNSMMQQWTDGYSLRITGAKGGTDTVAIEDLHKATDVSVIGTGEEHVLSIVRYSRLYPPLPHSILTVSIQVRPESSAYTLKQIGVYGKLLDGDGDEAVSETLIAIYQAEDGDEADVPSIATMADFVYEYAADLDVNYNGTASVNIDPNARVSRADMENALAELVVKRVRTVETVAVSDWHNPGTSWTQDGQSFTAPTGMYACALQISDVRAVSVVMDSWLDAGDEYVSSQIDYETMDDGWVLLTSAEKPTGSLSIGMMILI